MEINAYHRPVLTGDRGGKTGGRSETSHYDDRTGQTSGPMPNHHCYRPERRARPGSGARS
jgi:hypothetical protein